MAIQKTNTPLTSEKMNTNKIYNDDLMDVKVIDSATGKPIDIPYLQDSIRISNREEALDRYKSTIYTKTIPNNMLNEFLVSKKDTLNARSCIEALGMYCTERIKSQITTLGTKQEPYNQLDDNTVINNLNFTNYIKGGLANRNVNTGKDNAAAEKDETDGMYTRLAGNLGIGLGESTVLNPTFQYNKRDDVRTNPLCTKIGRVYSSSIMNNWPIVMFQPGRLKYNTGFMNLLGAFGGAGIADSYIRSGGEGISGVISGAFMVATDIVGLIGTVGSAIFGSDKMVEFKQAINLYNKYLNNLLSQMASFMGLIKRDYNDEEHYVGSISNLDITHILPTLHMSGGPTRYLINQFLPFRIQKGMIGSETFSNSTETNPLQEELNSAATENSDEGAAQNSLFKTVKKFALGALGAISDKYAVMSGQGRIALPDIYSSSSFSRSFTCSFQFHYPYGDPMGKFENIFLQMIMLLVLGLPRQTGRLTYTTPFATRVFVKNHIWISYGMIESISVTRGNDINDWGPDGLPKTVKVDVTIKDMEPNISLPLGARGPLGMSLETMFPSSGLTEYFMSIAGASLDSLTHAFRKDHLVNTVSVFNTSWSNFWNRDAAMAAISNNPMISQVMSLFTSIDLNALNQTGDIFKYEQQAAGEKFGRSKFFDTTSGLYTMFTGGGAQALQAAISDQVQYNNELSEFQAAINNAKK